MTNALAALSLPPVQRGLMAVVVCGALLPVVGVAIVALHIYPLRFTIMHAALLGLALGAWMGVDPLLAALILCAATGAGLGAASPHPRKASSAMGFLMPVAIALAFLVLSASGTHATDAFALLWGSILLSSWTDVALLAALGGVVLGITWRLRKPLALYLLDPELAWTSGMEIRWMSIMLFTILAVTMAAAVRLTGALLVDAVTILPALTAKALARSLPGMVLLAMAAGVVGNVVGLTLCLILDAPPGPILVLTAGSLTLAAALYSRQFRRTR